MISEVRSRGGSSVSTPALATHSCPYHGHHQAREARDSTQAHCGGDDAKRQRCVLTGDADERRRHRPEDELAEALQGGGGSRQVRVVGHRQRICRRKDQAYRAHHHDQRCDQHGHRESTDHRDE